jgi:aspartyl-tRNA(Asn)/glutamyl-tRNA(Gln) amidotransferase subunit A
MTSDLPTALEIAADVRSGRVSALAVADAAIARAQALNPKLNAFTTFTFERARAEAVSVDQSVAAGRSPGALAGVPYVVKNLFDLAGVVTVAGSKISRDDPAATEDATIVDRLKRAGAVCLGAVNMGEYAYDFTTENGHYGATRNPRDLKRSAGGSSGGSAAAVASGIVPIALGTDTNGSIRVPSSFCGIWGLKPTYGRLSRAGAFLFAESLDHVGPFARSVSDLAASYNAIQGPDARDPACANRAAEPVSSSGGDFASPRCVRLGGYFSSNASPEALEAVDRVAAALGSRGAVELPTPGLARSAAYIITAAEGGHRHLSRLRARAADFDPGTRDRFIAGAFTPAGWLLQAQKFRAQWRDQVRSLFGGADILIAPATPVSATELGQEMMTVGGASLPVRANLGIFTQPISFIGLPVIAAPVPIPGRLPIGVQLIAAPWCEATLFRAARILERDGVCAAPAALLQ